MSKYDFSIQKQLFEIAYQILEDYDITKWSFGGGTALSYCYYQHRMSYDIDIFLEDFSAISILLDNKEEIAKNLGISINLVKSSTSHLTFILKENDEGLKLDFLYGTALTSTPYQSNDIFNFRDVNVQTPIEILARKLKHRNTLTIRDFVDFAFSEQEDRILTKLKSENIVDIDRFFDVVEQFNSFDNLAFNLELKHLDSYIYKKKEGLSDTINSIMIPNKIIKIAVDDVEVVAFDHFIDTYQAFYEEIGSYSVFELEKDEVMQLLGKSFITYHDIMCLDIKIFKKKN